MESWLTPVLVFAGVILSSLVTYLIARRTTSGTVSTSDAASLWAESNKLRAEYKERAEKLEQRLEEVNNQLTEVMRELTDLRGKSVVQEEKIAELTQLLSELKKENQRLLALKRDT